MLRPEAEFYSVGASLWDRVREHGINAILAGAYLYFIYEQLFSYRGPLRWDVVLFTAKVSLELIFFVLRRPPKEFQVSPLGWGITMTAVFSVMLLRPERRGDYALAGVTLIQAGLIVHVLALLSLGRSFGIIPANRGVVSGGLYRFVRHPLYTSVIITVVGYLLANPSSYNLLVALVGIGSHVLRLREEELVLSRDSAYVAYCQRVKWRLIPVIF